MEALSDWTTTATTAAAMKISRPYSKQLAGNLPLTTVKFPAPSNCIKVLGLR